MKKLLLSSIVLITFSLSIILFQVSCKKEAIAQTTTTHTTTVSVDTIKQESKILFIKMGLPPITSAIWIVNYDGTNPQQINITLPANHVIDGTLGGTLAISPDHKKIFFSAVDTTKVENDSIFSCDIDGSNAQKVVPGAYKAVAF